MSTEAKSRYIKIVKITYNDVVKDTVEKKINAVANTITQNGGKVVSYMHEVLGIGFSTVYLVYTIVYEAKEEIPAKAFKKTKKVESERIEDEQ